MINPRQRNVIRQRVHNRIRAKVSGTADRPRLNVYRSLNHIYTQLIDDANGVTLASASSMGKSGESSEESSGSNKAGEKKAGDEKRERKSGGNVAAAAAVGKLIAERAKEKGIQKIVFDRGGYLYHGRIKALADAAREGGLDF